MERDPEGSPVIFMPGRMSREKGHFIMLDAARILMDRGVRFSLVMAGHGPLRGHVQHKLEELGLESVAAVVPSMAHEEVIDQMRKSTIVAIPSLSEGLSLVALEAMAVGVPVVASRTGGLAEVVEDNVNGLSVPVGDAAAFADAIGRLLTDKALWQRIAESSRTVASERYAASSVARSLATLYRSCLDAR
jgi:glycosyltransferase involved in cell wall biosynthesis